MLRNSSMTVIVSRASSLRDGPRQLLTPPALCSPQQTPVVYLFKQSLLLTVLSLSHYLQKLPILLPEDVPTLSFSTAISQASLITISIMFDVCYLNILGVGPETV